MENRKNSAVTSKQQNQMKSYCLYYPLDANSTCHDCNDLLEGSVANIEKHLRSHNIEKFEYRCGVCDKLWPSWRSVTTHYNKSSCHNQTSTTPSLSTNNMQKFSESIIDRKESKVTKSHNKESEIVTVVDEESETDDEDSSVLQHQTNENIRKHGYSSSVIPKNNEKESDFDSNVEDDGDDENETSESIGTQHSTIGVGLKETGKMKKTIDKIDNKYYCNLCAAGGWDKSVSLSQHMRHMHKSEYNASIEVPMIKRRWARDEILILAELESKIPSTDGRFINQILAKKFPSRTLESIKSRRKTKEYRNLLQQLRDCQAVTSPEGLECIYESSIVNSSTVANDSINNKEDNENNPDNTIVSVLGTDGTTYPNVKQFIKDKIIDGRVPMCTTMADALSHYVNHMLNSDPVEESLKGIREALGNVHSSQPHRDEKRNAGSKLRSAKSKQKAHEFAHYQRLFKKDKSKLASEIFDGVDNSAFKPPMSVAYEHFRKIWETDTKDTGKLEDKVSVGTDVLLAPITREEIAWAIDHTKNDTAVGPDHVSLKDIRRIARNELWCAYNIWIGSRRVPNELKANRTVLLPKGKDDLGNIKNWRPITIASILIRLYNKILACRMQSVFRTSSKQTGFKPVNGVGQNVAILHNLLRHARANKNNLFVCLLDVSKAFDSVPHESIIRALVRNGCPSEFIDIIKNEYENSYTALSCMDGDSPLVYIKRGVKQGDPMSSILFNLVIDELFEIIGDRFGYELQGVGNVNARAFADDIALISGSEQGMQQLLLETEEFLNARGLELNVDKCIGIGLRKAGKVKKSQIADSSVNNPPSFMVKNKPIRLLGINEQCRYLGVLFTPFGAVDPRASVAKLKLALESLKKAPLKPQQKVLMLRSYLIPRFIFSFIHTECYPKLIGQQDRLIRRWLKEILRLPSSICSEFFYLPIKEGGLGVGKLYDTIGLAKVRLHGSFARAGDKCLQFLVETQGSSMHSRWCNAMKLSTRPSAVEINQSKVLFIDESRVRLSETVHGSGSELFRNSPITNQWLSGDTRIIKGRTFIKAIQMRTNTIPTLVSTSRGRDTNKTCRRCSLADETLVHILQTCPITQGMRCQRHNNVCRKVSEKLRSKGFQVFQEQGIPSPELQTKVSRPDLIAIRGDQALVLDVTCVFESNKNSLQDAYRRKVDRYKPLAETIKQKYNISDVEFHGLCIGSRGAYDPRHLSIWHSIGFSGAELALLAVGVIEDSLRTITLFNNANSLRI